MRKLFSVTLLAGCLAIGVSVQAQTQQEWEQYLTLYITQNGIEATRNHVIEIAAGRTTSSLLQEQAFSLLELSLSGFSPCVASRIARCDEDFSARLTTATINLTVAAAACVIVAGAGGSPVASAICLTAVVLRHEIELRAAESAHRACLRRAREDCPQPTPTPSPTPGPRCSILGSETAGDEKEASTRDIGPLLPDCSLDPADPCYCPLTPIMIDVAGNGFDLTNVADGVMFNMTGFGSEPLGWSQANSDDAFLALDLSGNGLIDNGAELFGNFSRQPEPAAGTERNGFAALAMYDNNADGKIDVNDPVYYALRLWQDKNHNGVSEPGELHSLESLGLKTLFTEYRRSKRVDKHGNEFRYRAKVNDFNNKQLGRWAWDVFLVSTRPSVTPSGGSQ